MASRGIPGWLAPWVGLGICGGLGYYVAYHDMHFNPPSMALWFVAGMAAGGFVVGCILWLKDRRKNG